MGRRQESRTKEETWAERLERFQVSCRKLIAASKELNAARDELRACAAGLAGCDLRGWNYELIEQYVDLALEQYVDQRKLHIAIQVLEGLRLAEEGDGHEGSS